MNVNTTYNAISDLISSKKEFIFKQTINIILVFIIMFVFGCFDFLHATFHFEYLTNQNYWVSVTMKTIGDICAFNIGINLLLDEAINRDTVLNEAKLQYDNLNKYKDKDFDYFIDNVYNRKMKIVAYKNKIDFHIRMLNRVSKPKDRILYSSERDKTGNKYCIRRGNLEALKTDEFIEKNFDNLDVRYHDVDPSIFALELDGNKRVVQNKVTGSITAGRVKASATTIMSVILVSMFLSSILLQPNQEEFEDQVVGAVNWALKACGDVGVILWQLFRGVVNAKKIVSSQLTIPCTERVKILKEYYAWREEQGKDVPQYYTSLIKEEKVIEISRKDLDKIRQN